ncbi:GAF domain-containing protein, partial [Roseomonas sp. DSM 102946]|nr:GAF domain-containing protein [Roseomonas sp. DSM 102946]
MSGSPARAHADQVRAVLQDGAAARSVVAASWRRSMTQYGLDPENHRGPWRMTEAELREARARMEPLIQLAQPSMDRLFQAVGGIGCCVLLTDRNGVPVERRGAPADDAQFRDWGLWTGTVWSEAQEGTNGIGTCIAEQRALTIHRDQHFHTRNAGLSCST